MSNNGLMIADGIGAGLRTFAQMQGIDANKKMMGLRDAQAKMQSDEHEARMRESEQRSKLADAEIKSQEDENTFKLNALNARKMRSMENAGIEFTHENEQAFNSLNPRARFDFIQSEPVRKSRQIYKDAMQGKISMNSEDAYRAFETIFPEVITGATDGRKVKVNRLVPAKDGSGIYVGLEVTNPDGTVNPNGGLTVGRSADPNAEMRLVTFDQLNRTVGTMEQADNAWSDPRYRKAYMDYYDPQPDNHVSAKDQSIIDKNKAQAALYQSRAKNEASGGAGGAVEPTQRQKDYDFALTILKMSPEDAKEWAFSDKTPSERAEDYANRMVAAESGVEEKPEGYSPHNSWNSHRKAYMSEYGGQSGKQESSTKPASKPATKISASTIDGVSGRLYAHLKNNPQDALREIENFKARYGVAPIWANEFNQN